MIFLYKGVNISICNIYTMERCKKGTRKYKPLGPGCHTHEDIEIYQNTKGRKKTVIAAEAEPVTQAIEPDVQPREPNGSRAIEPEVQPRETGVPPKKKTRRVSKPVLKPPSPVELPPSPTEPPPSPVELPPSPTEPPPSPVELPPSPTEPPPSPSPAGLPQAEVDNAIDDDSQHLAADDDDSEYIVDEKNLKRDYYQNLKNPNTKHAFLYPSLDDPYLSKRISLRKEFETLMYDGGVKPDIKKLSDLICSKAEFELLPHQRFVKNFMSKQTPYNSLLLYHGLGSGKTCSAIGIAEEMRDYMKQTGISQRILIVASGNVQDNFKLQLFDERKLMQNKDGSWYINSCVGSKILNEINPTNSQMEKEKILSQANTIINNNYAFLGYLQFANFIEKKTKMFRVGDKIIGKKGGQKGQRGTVAKVGPKEGQLMVTWENGQTNEQSNVTVDYESITKEKLVAEQELIKKHFNDRLVIIDEVHNCTKESKTLSKQLKKLAKYAENLRFVLLSATPMYNSHREIIWLTNLMNLNDGRSAIKYDDVFTADGDIKKPGSDNDDIGLNLLRRKLNGYVSYVRGENPYTFPFRVYQKTDVAYPKLDMKRLKPFESLTVMKDKLYLTPIGELQKKAYDLILHKSLESGDGLFFNDKSEESLENMEALGYTKLQAPLQSLIIVFPHPDFNDIVKEIDDSGDSYRKLIGIEGLKNNMSFKEVRGTGADGQPTFMKYDYEYKRDVPRIFSETVLPHYSSKISSVCAKIRESATRTMVIDGIETVVHGGIVLVYTQYIDGGVVPLSLALEEMGFARHNGKSLFAKDVVKVQLDVNTMKPRTEVPFDEFKQAKYMIITGDKYFSQDNAEDLKYATSKENKFGENVKVILISRAASEGLDFKYVRQVHILEPWYNLNRIEQIIGRGVRNRSHCGLPFEERNVEIYLHATASDNETADMYVYRYAEKKAKIIGEVTRVMKSVAVDCVLNVSQTQFTDKDFEAAAQSEVQIVSSTMTEPQMFELGDKKFSEVCDYKSDCAFKCYPEDGAKKIKDKNVNELYGKEFIGLNSSYIVDKLKALYKTSSENAYHWTTIRSTFEGVPDEEIYYALTQLMGSNEVVLDKYGRQGRIINKDQYYVFQPLEIIGENGFSLYDSKVPVKNMNTHVRYELPKSDEEFKTPTVFVPMEIDSNVAHNEHNVFGEFLEKMEHNIAIATSAKPNLIAAKNDDWFYNLNSIRDVKGAGVSVSVMVRLEIMGFDAELIRKYVTNHMLDLASHDMRLELAKHVLAPGFKAATPLARHVAEYFDYLVYREGGINGLLLLKDKAPLVLYNMEDWSEYSLGEFVQCKPMFERRMQVARENMSDLLGFVNIFVGKDNVANPVFRVKNMKQVRNNKGAYIMNEKKADIVKRVNLVLGMAGQPFSFDDETSVAASRNTDDISQIAFAGMFELLVRKYNDERVDGKTWFLRPEQAAFLKIESL
jgi:hypothetical protein